MENLFWLEDSRIGLLVSSTEWGYPIVLSLHALGMGVMVGVSLMLGFRVLGFASAIPVTAMAPYWRIGLAGFFVNLLSGSALFLGSASTLYGNWAFRAKIVMVVLGLVLTWVLVRICVRGTGEIAPAHRILAASAALAWLIALITGRMIGYLL